MPEISEENKNIFNRLVAEYNLLPRYKQWFYPRALRAAFRHYEAEHSLTSAFNLCMACLNTTWFFQKWFLSSLSAFSSSSFFEALIKLNQDGLLTGEVGRDNFNAVVQHKDPYSVGHALFALNMAGLITGEAGRANRDMVAGHQDPGNVAKGVLIIYKAKGLLAGKRGQDNFNALAEHQNHSSIVRALLILYYAGLLTGDAAQDNFDIVMKHDFPWGVAKALEMLKTAGLLTLDNIDTAQYNFDTVVRHTVSMYIAVAIIILNKAGLLTGETGRINREAVVRHHFRITLANVLRTLNDTDLLAGDAAQDNFNAIVAHQDIRYVAPALDALNNAGLLIRKAGQRVFDSVVKTYSAILIQQETVGLWNYIRYASNPSRLLTGEHFEEIIAICDAHHDNVPKARCLFNDYVRQNILRVNTSQAGEAAPPSWSKFFTDYRIDDDDVEGDVFLTEAYPTP